MTLERGGKSVPERNISYRVTEHIEKLLKQFLSFIAISGYESLY